MEALYWLNDTEGHARLIEGVRPFVETHGSAEQRASFFLSIVQLSLRRDRYLVADETLEFAQAACAAVKEVSPLPWWWSGFTFGFTLLFHGDLDKATAVLQESLEEGERQGDAGTRARSLTYLMVADRKRGDVNAVRKAIGSVIERAREASLPEYEAMAIANRAWVEWRMGEHEAAVTDAAAALEMWKRLPVRYFFDWMALWPLVAMALASGRVEAAAEYARGMLPPPQQLLQEPVRALVESAVHAWDAGEQAETEELLGRAVRSAGGFGYL
jgi:tetratricopeptide (TPR) repeat protein